ncbi:MAG: methyltransferase domain-containing protein [Planctomycetes bacterium]|nr:methyltransferase domain-containing protein [Planctomycetota bacterium]
MDSSEATATVALLYRAVLGREADPAGLRHHTEELASGRCGVPQLLQRFLDSAEARERRRLWRPNLTGFPAFPEAEVFVAPDVADALFAKTATYWRQTAARPEEIYWSVLTEKNWNRALTPDDRKAFLRTGEPYANRVLAAFQDLTGRPLPAVRCLDFGCGVGRLAVHFAARTAGVCAVDFSEAHLAELRENARLFGGADKVSTWLLRLPRDLDAVPACDLVYSFVALQHNTPPVMARMLRGLLDHVRPGGLAFLHLTLAKAGYEGFTVREYLADPQAGTRMEVHILPRANVDEVARRAGCEVVRSACVGGNDYAYSEEFVFRRVAGGRDAEAG